MRIPTIVSSRESVKALSGLVVLLSLVIVCGSGYGIYYYMNHLAKGQQYVYVLDKNGSILMAGLDNEITTQERESEYYNHVKLFYTLFYSFDETSFKDNMVSALELIGSRGDALYEEYLRNDTYENLQKYNNQVDVEIEDIIIDMESVPVRGLVKAIQINRIGKKEAKRRLDCEFTIVDTKRRTKENPHMAEIKDWKVVNTSIVKDK